MSRVRTAASGKWMSRWWSDRVLRPLLSTLVVLIPIEFVIILVGRGPVLATLTWVELAAQSFSILAAISVAFFCFGRYRVLGETPTLWVGLAFWAYAIFSALYVAGLATVAEEGIPLDIPPNAGDWFFHLKWSAFAILLLVAAFVRPAIQATPGWRVVILLFSLVGAVSLVVGALAIAFSDLLPPLVAAGRFTSLNLSWIAGLIVVLLLGAISGLGRYITDRQVVVGYAAITQIVIAVRFGNDIFGGQLYDVVWYFNRFLLSGALAAMLLALLGEYVGLLLRERDLTYLAERRAAELRTTIESMADALFVLDREGNVVDANMRGVELSGFRDRSEALRPMSEYQQFVRATHLDGRPLRPEEYSGARALKGETFRGFLERALTWDGRELLLELSGAPIHDPTGEIVGAVVVIRDVTELERVRAQAALARTATAIAEELELEGVLRVILEEARAALGADMVALFTADLGTQKLTQMAQLGFPEDVVDKLRELPLDSPALTARAAASGQIQVAEDLSALAAEFWPAAQLAERAGIRSGAAVPLESKGRLIGVLAFFALARRRFMPVDFETMRTLAHLFSVGLDNAQLFRAVQVERTRLQVIIEYSPAGILVAEAPSGGVVMASQAAVDLLGREVPRGTSIDRNPERYGLCQPDGRLYAPSDLPLSRALRGETVSAQEVVVRRPDGAEVSVLVNAAPLQIDAKIEGAIAIFQNITPIREAERQREEFISVVAHDLKGALTVIRGFSDLLLRPESKKALTPMSQKAVEAIAGGTRRLERMIEDLLDISRIEARRLSLEKQSIDLAALVQDVVARAGELTRGHPVRVEVTGAIPSLEADPDRLEQVLTNLLSNAGKYSYPSTPLTVSVEPYMGEVMVSVTNEGPGIPPEEIPRLFKRFHRTKMARIGEARGLGLGLYIARGLVEAHGGKIWVESVPGKTTAFRFTLPSTSSRASEAPRAESQP